MLFHKISARSNTGCLAYLGKMKVIVASNSFVNSRNQSWTKFDLLNNGIKPENIWVIRTLIVKLLSQAKFVNKK